MATTAAPASTQLSFTVDFETVQRLVLRPEVAMSDDEFLHFCQQYELLRIERNAEGDIIIMAPVMLEGGFAESEVSFQLANWAKRDGRGLAFNSNTGITLPDGSTLSPDAFWITKEQWKAIPRKQRQQFAPFVPPFVIEVRSQTDRRKDLHEKMLAYVRNGVELGWLIDPIARKVSIYKPNEPVIELDDPARVEGEAPVAGFVLDLKAIYDQLEQ